MNTHLARSSSLFNRRRGRGRWRSRRRGHFWLYSILVLVASQLSSLPSIYLKEQPASVAAREAKGEEGEFHSTYFFSCPCCWAHTFPGGESAHHHRTKSRRLIFLDTYYYYSNSLYGKTRSVDDEPLVIIVATTLRCCQERVLSRCTSRTCKIRRTQKYA